MLKYLVAVALLFLITACNTDSDFTLTGNVSGLKKGTLYLQKVEDTTLINIDSVVIKGDPTFKFQTQLKEPQILYLTLEKVDRSDYDDRITLFAEPGEMTITTSLKSFEGQAAITGSENQLKMDEYKKIILKYNDQNLDLIKKSVMAQKNEMEDSIIIYDKKLQNLIKRKYLYTVNFAINNKNLEIAPFLAVSEIFDANVKYLDTIYKSLEPNIRRSKYGKTLKDFIKERKAEKTNVSPARVINDKKKDSL